MRRFAFLLLAIMTVMTVGVAATHRHGHDRIMAVYQIFNPDGWAYDAAVTLVFDGGQSTGQTNKHGLVTLEAPVGTTIGELSAVQGIYCLPPTLVEISREHPGKYEAFAMDVCY